MKFTLKKMFVCVMLVCVAVSIGVYVSSKPVQLDLGMTLITYQVKSDELVQFRKDLAAFITSEGYLEVVLNGESESFSKYFDNSSGFPVMKSVSLADYFFPKDYFPVGRRRNEHIQIEISRSWYSRPIGYFAHQNANLEFELETVRFNEFFQRYFESNSESGFKIIPSD